MGDATEVTIGPMKTLYVQDGKQWRSWLAKNGSRAKEIWLIYPKRHSGKERIPYDDAVEEALCFGWIDGVTGKLDGERYVQRFTPRRPSSRWSQINIRRARKLIAAGRMTAAGLQAFRPERKTRRASHGVAQEAAGDIREAKSWVGEFSEFPAVLPADDHRVGGECEEGRDADEAPGETDGVLRRRIGGSSLCSG